jgi:threonine dehydrogenase-like Zn-dependent dehydrogenase
MRAVVVHEDGSSSIEEVPRPEPTGTDVLIDVDRVQLSITECRLYRGHDIAHRAAVDRQLRDGSARLFGHEFCGTVVEVGGDVTRFGPGDRVYPPGKIPCGECGYCRTGYRQYCSDKTQIGYDRPGGLSEYVLQPETVLAGLPDGVSDAEGAAMQPLASAVLCVEDAEIETGDVVAVVGAGVMGSHCGQLALAQGASEVFAVDIVDEKLSLAADNGMTPVDGRTEDVAERVRDATGGVGADVVFEAVGADQTHGTEGDDPLAQAYRTVRRGGTIVQVGHITGEIAVRPRAFRSKNATWVNPTVGTVQVGPNANTGDVAAELVASGRLSIEGYVSHELDGLAAFEEAVEITLDNERKLGPAQMIVS